MESPVRIYICTHTHCRANGGEAVFRACERAIWEADVAEQVELLPSGCQGRCSDGPNAAVWPGPTRYGRLTPEQVRRVLECHLHGQEPLHDALADPNALPFR